MPSSVPPPVPSNRSAVAPREDARDVVRVVEEAIAPLRERVDELERTMLETIVRLAKTPASPTDATLSAQQVAERKRRQALIAIGVVIVLGIVMLFGMLASCR
jgi:hypothetical protein